MNSLINTLMNDLKKLTETSITHIVSYSGGLGSAITADMVIKKYGVDNVILLFADTLVEDQDLYRFNNDLIGRLGCRFIRIAEGRTPWQVFNDRRYIGNTRVDPCSEVLKRKFIKKWIFENFTPINCVIWIGIDSTEEHRLKPVIVKNKPYVYRSILIENNVFLTTEYKNRWCDINNIRIPRLYDYGFAHNNCGGFCVKAGLAQFKKLYEYLPDIYLENEMQEELLMRTHPRTKPFLRKQVKGVLRYMTMKEYRLKYLDSLTDDESLDFGGCGCAL